MTLRTLWNRYWIEITIGVLLAAWFGCMGLCAVSELLKGTL